MLQAGCMFPQYFNPRTPYGMRLDIFSFRKRSSNFNPRTPYGMRHFHYIEGGRHIVISIHAPLTGCDLRFVSYVHLAFYFNPRTPYGMRQLISSSLLLSYYFNPRTPYGMRRHSGRHYWQCCKFQSTHPLRDATPADQNENL